MKTRKPFGMSQMQTIIIVVMACLAFMTTTGAVGYIIYNISPDNNSFYIKSAIKSIVILFFQIITIIIIVGYYLLKILEGILKFMFDSPSNSTIPSQNHNYTNSYTNEEIGSNSYWAEQNEQRQERSWQDAQSRSEQQDNGTYGRQTEETNNNWQQAADDAYQADRYNRWVSQETEDVSALGSASWLLFGNTNPPDDFE